jgi:hypothetical protein
LHFGRQLVAVTTVYEKSVPFARSVYYGTLNQIE